MADNRDDDGGGVKHFVVHDDQTKWTRAENYLTAELAKLGDHLEAIEKRMLSEDDVKELRAFLSNRRAFSAATGALKSTAIWVVALAAAMSVIFGGFVEAVKAAIRGLKP